MKRAIGFNLGLRGDLIMNTVAARSFKQQNPGWHFTLGVGPQFADMEPLFREHPHIDAFHAYDSYDNWPNEKDQEYLRASWYNSVFHGMPQHSHPRWHDYVHQAEETCWMNGLPPPKDGLQCHLNKWFDVPDYSGYIALNYIGAFYAGYPNNKSYSPLCARELVKLIKAKGYKVIVLGDPKEPPLEGTERKGLSYFESVRTMLGCRALVGIDSGLTWVASAYSHPTVAGYASEYYGNRVSAIQPINPQANYVSAPRIEDISVDAVAQALQNIGI